MSRPKDEIPESTEKNPIKLKISVNTIQQTKDNIVRFTIIPQDAHFHDDVLAET